MFQELRSASIQPLSLFCHLKLKSEFSWPALSLSSLERLCSQGAIPPCTTPQTPGEGSGREGGLSSHLWTLDTEDVMGESPTQDHVRSSWIHWPGFFIKNVGYYLFSGPGPRVIFRTGDSLLNVAWGCSWSPGRVPWRLAGISLLPSSCCWVEADISFSSGDPGGWRLFSVIINAQFLPWHTTCSAGLPALVFPRVIVFPMILPKHREKTTILGNVRSPFLPHKSARGFKSEELSLLTLFFFSRQLVTTIGWYIASKDEDQTVDFLVDT